MNERVTEGDINIPVENGRDIRNAVRMEKKNKEEVCTNKKIKMVDNFVFRNCVEMDRSEIKTNETISPNAKKYDKNFMLQPKDKECDVHITTKCAFVPFSNDENALYEFPNNKKIMDFKKENVCAWKQYNPNSFSYLNTSKMKNSLCTTSNEENKNFNFHFKCTKVELKTGVKLLNTHTFNCTVVVAVVILRNNKNSFLARNRKKSNTFCKNREWKKILKCVFCNVYHLDEGDKIKFKIKHNTKKSKNKKGKDKEKEKTKENEIATVDKDVSKYKGEETTQSIFDFSTPHFIDLPEHTRGKTSYSNKRNGNEEHNTTNNSIINKTNSSVAPYVKQGYTCETNSSVHSFTCCTSNKESDRKGKLYTFRNKKKRVYVIFFIVHKNKNILKDITKKGQEKKKSVEVYLPKASTDVHETTSTLDGIQKSKNSDENDLQKENKDTFPQIELSSQNIAETQVAKKVCYADNKGDDSKCFQQCHTHDNAVSPIIYTKNNFSSKSYFFIKIKSFKNNYIILDKKHIQKTLELDDFLKYLPAKTRTKLNAFLQTPNICKNKEKTKPIYRNRRGRHFCSCFLVEANSDPTTCKKEVQWNVVQDKEECPSIITPQKIMSLNNTFDFGIHENIKDPAKNSIETEKSTYYHESLKWGGKHEWKDVLHRSDENVLQNNEDIYKILNKETSIIWGITEEEQKNIFSLDNNSNNYDSDGKYKLFGNDESCFNYSFFNNENREKTFLNKTDKIIEEENMHHEKREELQSEWMSNTCFIDDRKGGSSIYSQQLPKESENASSTYLVDHYRKLDKEKENDIWGFQHMDTTKKKSIIEKNKLQTNEKQSAYWKSRSLKISPHGCSCLHKKTNLTCFNRKQNMFLNITRKKSVCSKTQKKKNPKKRKAEGLQQWNKNVKCVHRHTSPNYSTFSCDKKRNPAKNLSKDVNDSLYMKFPEAGLRVEEPFFELVDDVKPTEDTFVEKELETVLSDNKKYILKKDVMNTIIPPGLSEEVALQENVIANRLLNESLLYKQDANRNRVCNRKKKRIKSKDAAINKEMPVECADSLLQSNNCENKMTYDGVDHINHRQNRDVSMHRSTNSNTTNSNTVNSHGNSSNRNSYMNDSSYEYTNYENSYTNSYDRSVERSVERCADRSFDGRMSDLDRNMDFEVEVMERHSSILVNRGIKTKKYVDYSLYNTYAKSSFLQCAEQADNHFIGNYILNFQDENFSHLRQKIKLCLSRTFANLKTTSETCVLHFTNLIFDLYISKFASKDEILESIISEVATDEKQYSDVMIQLLKEFYPKIYNEFIHKEKLKNKFKNLYKELIKSCDLIYHFIAVTCLFISQKYYNYRLISIDLIARTYCKSHLEGLSKIYSVSNELIKESSPDYYCITQYLDTTFSAHSVNKCFALEVELCILKKLNYDLSIPTAYSLLDSLLKGNENINFLKVRNDYNITEGEILLRVASIDNNFLKYKASTLAMAVYEILSFNISRDKMQKEWFPENKQEEEDKHRILLPDEVKNRVDVDVVKETDRRAIAEEEERLIIATKYLNEKSKLHKIIKKVILKTCIIIDKKIPQYYYEYGNHLTADLKSYISTYKKSKRKFLKKLQKKKLAKKKRNEKKKSLHNTQPNNTKLSSQSQSKSQSQSQSQRKDKIKRTHKKNKKEKKRKQATEKNGTRVANAGNVNPHKTKKEVSVKEEGTERLKNASHEDAARMQIRKAKKEMKRENQKKKEQRERLEEAALFGTIENTNPDNIKKEKGRKHCSLLTPKKKTSTLKMQQKNKKLDKGSDEYKFYVYKSKLRKKLKEYLKRISKLHYPELPEKFCSGYMLQGNKIRLYLKEPYVEEKKEKKTRGDSKENPDEISRRASICGTPESRRNRRDRVRHDKEEDGYYVIGSKTKSTDSHLVYYFNYISKLRSRLMCGLKFILKRINKIEKTEIRIVTRNLKQLIKSNRRRKKERKRKLKEAADSEKPAEGQKNVSAKQEDKHRLTPSKNKKRYIVKIKKNVSLLKQLHNEIKAFFIWLKKTADIEVRPLLKFTDLRFLYQANMYKRHYFRYVNKIMSLKDEDENTQEKQNGAPGKPNVQKELDEIYKDDNKLRGMIQIIGASDGGLTGDGVDGGNDAISYTLNQNEKGNYPGISSILFDDYFDELKKTIVQDNTFFQQLCEKYEKRANLEDEEDVEEEEEEEEDEENNEGEESEEEGKEEKEKKRKGKNIKEDRKMERAVDRSVEEEFVHLKVIKGHQSQQPQRRNTLRQKRNEQCALSRADGNRKRSRHGMGNERRRDIQRDTSDINPSAQKSRADMYSNARQPRGKTDGSTIPNSRKPLERGRRGRDRTGVDHAIQMDNALKSHIFPLPPAVTSIRKTQNDWITINDPQVDECARELMESFLKWKNSDFISKNWTYCEYSHCKDYYYSLVFGDLKPPEALKGINEMMQMKYIHLLNIYYDVQLNIHQSEMLE